MSFRVRDRGWWRGSFVKKPMLVECNYSAENVTGNGLVLLCPFPSVVPESRDSFTGEVQDVISILCLSRLGDS
jgi:hypothetical protein